VISGGHTAYASWWEAYELAGAQETEARIGATIRHDSNTQGDRDDSLRTEGTPL
jgi:hypothetical protein